MIAAVQGVAVGAGAVMDTAADIRILGPKARFGFIFPQVGLCGADIGSAYLLPRIVGLGVASELLYTGEIIDANRAIEIGLGNRLVPGESLVEAATALAEKIARGPFFAHTMTKQMIDDEAHLNLSQAIEEAEAQAQAICMQHLIFERHTTRGFRNNKPKFEGAE